MLLHPMQNWHGIIVLFDTAREWGMSLVSCRASTDRIIHQPHLPEIGRRPLRIQTGELVIGDTRTVPTVASVFGKNVQTLKGHVDFDRVLGVCDLSRQLLPGADWHLFECNRLYFCSLWHTPKSPANMSFLPHAHSNTLA